MKSSGLLSRDDFRNQVWIRDKGKCVCCANKGQDVHHLMERKLFVDGGNYANNGVVLCAEHHILAEKTLISPKELRRLAGITEEKLPEHLEEGFDYDKWGNVMLSNGTRWKGEMFYEEQVQKILKEAGVLGDFAPYIKYPRTGHLPWSPNLQNNDRRIEHLHAFEGKEIVVTPKYDGENTTFYRDYMHARSLDSKNHPSRNFVKKLHGEVAYEIPKDWRITGENLYAKHSIWYENLESYFYVYGVWNDKNQCLSWDDTKEWCQLLNLKLVPSLYEGKWDEELIRNLYKPEYNGDPCEGYVVRLRESFSYGQFKESCAKYVRQNHVQTSKFWMSEAIVPNKIRLLPEMDL